MKVFLMILATGLIFSAFSFGSPIPVTPSITAGITPLWSYALTNTPSINGTNAATWNEAQFNMDKSGNTAILLNLFDATTNSIGYNVLWISSKGQLLVNPLQQAAGTPPVILNVSRTVLYVSNGGILNPHGSPLAITRYTLKGNILSLQYFGPDDEGVISSGLMQPPISSIGFVGHNVSGTNNIFNCYLY